MMFVRGKHRLLSLSIAMGLGISSALGATAVLAAGPSVAVSRSAMARDVCAQFVAEFKAGASIFNATDRAKIAKMADTSCYYEVREETVAAAPLGILAANAATTCRTTARTYGIYSLGLEIATARTDMYWCSNGTKAWHNSDHYQWCRVTTAPLWGSAVDWCGVVTNNLATISMGQNFHIFAYSAPWWNRYGWTRFTGSRTGAAGGSTGFCCN